MQEILFRFGFCRQLFGIGKNNHLAVEQFFPDPGELFELEFGRGRYNLGILMGVNEMQFLVRFR